MNFFDGFDAVAEESLTRILNEMVRELASEEFASALASSRGSRIADPRADPSAPVGSGTLPVATEPPGSVLPTGD